MDEPRVIVLDEYEQELPTKLMPWEIADRASTAARLDAELLREEDNLTTVKADFKAKMNGLASDRGQALREVRTGEAQILVKCRKELVPREQAIRTVRIDTGEILSERAATGPELQLHLIESKPHRKSVADDEIDEIAEHSNPAP